MKRIAFKAGVNEMFADMEIKHLFTALLLILLHNDTKYKHIILK